MIKISIFGAGQDLSRDRERRIESLGECHVAEFIEKAQESDRIFEK
jgi:hypothetical protein